MAFRTFAVGPATTALRLSRASKYTGIYRWHPGMREAYKARKLSVQSYTFALIGDIYNIFHDTVLAYIFDEFKAAGISFRGGPGNSTKKTFSHCICKNLTDREYRNLQGILPDLVLDCSFPPGQPAV